VVIWVGRGPGGEGYDAVVKLGGLFGRYLLEILRTEG
jgi:hypothetical protein